jgi:hypothetical protein
MKFILHIAPSKQLTCSKRKTYYSFEVQIKVKSLTKIASMVIGAIIYSNKAYVCVVENIFQF